MKHYPDETRQKIVRLHIQDGWTLKSLAAEYGVSQASISNWVRHYRKECQTNNKEKSQLELMEEVRKLRQEKAELEKENDFLKKAAAFFAKEIDKRHIVLLITIKKILVCVGCSCIWIFIPMLIIIILKRQGLTIIVKRKLFLILFEISTMSAMERSKSILRNRKHQTFWYRAFES